MEAQSKLLSAYISDSPSCYPPLEGLRNTLEVQSSWDLKAAQAKAEDFLDLRLADQLRSSGCIDRFYGK